MEGSPTAGLRPPIGLCIRGVRGYASAAGGQAVHAAMAQHSATFACLQPIFHVTQAEDGATSRVVLVGHQAFQDVSILVRILRELRCGQGRRLATAIGDIHVMAADTEIGKEAAKHLAEEPEPNALHEELPGESSIPPAQFTSAREEVAAEEPPTPAANSPETDAPLPTDTPSGRSELHTPHAPVEPSGEPSATPDPLSNSRDDVAEEGSHAPATSTTEPAPPHAPLASLLTAEQRTRIQVSRLAASTRRASHQSGQDFEAHEVPPIAVEPQDSDPDSHVATPIPLSDSLTSTTSVSQSLELQTSFPSGDLGLNYVASDSDLGHVCVCCRQNLTCGEQLTRLLCMHTVHTSCFSQWEQAELARASDCCRCPQCNCNLLTLLTPE